MAFGEKVKVKCSDSYEYIGILEKGTGYEEGYYHCKQNKVGVTITGLSSHIKSMKVEEWNYLAQY